jgi:hypothetical protein
LVSSAATTNEAMTAVDAITTVASAGAGMDLTSCSDDPGAGRIAPIIALLSDQAAKPRQRGPVTLRRVRASVIR